MLQNIDKIPKDENTKTNPKIMKTNIQLYVYILK